MDVVNEALVAYLDLIGDKPYCSCLLYEVLTGQLRVLGIEVAQPDGGDEFRMGLCDVHKFDEDIQVLLRGVLRIMLASIYIFEALPAERIGHYHSHRANGTAGARRGHRAVAISLEQPAAHTVCSPAG